MVRSRDERGRANPTRPVKFLPRARSEIIAPALSVRGTFVRGYDSGACSRRPHDHRGQGMKLFYSHNLNPRVAVAVARYLESPVEYIRVSPRHPDQIAAFRLINPNALVPVLSDGTTTLWETDAIACRLAGMSGSDFWRTGETLPEMMMWVSWSAYHLTRAADPLYFYRVVAPTFSAEPPDPAILEQALRGFPGPMPRSWKIICRAGSGSWAIEYHTPISGSQRRCRSPKAPGCRCRNFQTSAFGTSVSTRSMPGVIHFPACHEPQARSRALFWIGIVLIIGSPSPKMH